MTLRGCALPLEKSVKDTLRDALTFASALPVEVICPLAGVVHLDDISDLGIGEQTRVGLGDLGAWVLAVRRPWAVAGRVCVSLGGGHQRRRGLQTVGHLICFGVQAGVFLPGRVRQVSSGRQRGTPVLLVLLRA